MPRKRILSRKSSSRRRVIAPPQETLVNDARSGLTPSQLVEHKLITILRSAPLPASHLQASRMRRALSQEE